MSRTHSNTLAHTHTHAHMHTSISTHACTRTDTTRCISEWAQAHTRARARTHTHTRTQPRAAMLTSVMPYSLSLLLSAYLSLTATYLLRFQKAYSRGYCPSGRLCAGGSERVSAGGSERVSFIYFYIFILRSLAHAHALKLWCRRVGAWLSPSLLLSASLISRKTSSWTFHPTCSVGFLRSGSVCAWDSERERQTRVSECAFLSLTHTHALLFLHWFLCLIKVLSVEIFPCLSVEI